jgi:hypothetical protein
MQKKPDWQKLLNEFLAEHKDKDFAWGEWDCCIFSNAALKAICGEDVIPKELKWTDEKSAQKAIKTYGKTLKGALTKACKAAGMKEINVNYATAGDLICYKEESELAGIHDGFNIITPTDGGFSAKQPSLALKAWRIPDG